MIQSKERNTEYKREWRKKNPKRQRELSRQNNKKQKKKRKPLTEEQKERKRAYDKLWKANNPDRIAAYELKKKTRICTTYMAKRRFERNHPGRGMKYYYNNREAILAQKNIKRSLNPSP